MEQDDFCRVDVTDFLTVNIHIFGAVKCLCMFLWCSNVLQVYLLDISRYITIQTTSIRLKDVAVANQFHENEV